MPQIELCCYHACDKESREIDPKSDKFVVLEEKSRSTPRAIAHVECAQKYRDEPPPMPMKG
jgi:hypothetical protein